MNKYLDSLGFVVAALLFGLLVVAPAPMGAVAYIAARQYVGFFPSLVAGVLTSIVVFALVNPHVSNQQCKGTNKYLDSLGFIVASLLFGLLVVAPPLMGAVAYFTVRQYVGLLPSLFAGVLTSMVVFALISPHLPGEQ